MVRPTNRMATLRMLAALALCVAASTWGVRAQQKEKGPRSKVTALTPTDYIEIQQLVSRYGYALDTGAPEGTGNEYARLFTPDGVFVGPGIPDNTQGWEKLTALAQIPQGRGGRRGPTYVSHFLMNHLIEASAEGATGTVYLLVINFGGNAKPTTITMGGHYDDLYVKGPEGWRFKKREFVRGSVRLAVAPSRTIEMMRPAPEPNAAKAGQALTAMDYIEIRKLVAGYAYGLDGGADNGYTYADLFAPDATFGRTTGRENLAGLARREPHGPQYTRHFLTNVVIEPSPEGATGKQYLAVIDVAEDGKPTSIFLGGRYEDVYERTAQGWRFKSRNLVRAQTASTPAQPGSSGSNQAPPSPAGR
jgi:hypothetical protein